MRSQMNATKGRGCHSRRTCSSYKQRPSTSSPVCKGSARHCAYCSSRQDRRCNYALKEGGEIGKDTIRVLGPIVQHLSDDSWWKVGEIILGKSEMNEILVIIRAISKTETQIKIEDSPQTFKMVNKRVFVSPVEYPNKTPAMIATSKTRM